MMNGAVAARTMAAIAVGTMGLVLGGCGGPGKASDVGDTHAAAAKASTDPRSIHRFDAKDIDGQPVSLGRYAGKVLLVVNVASQCGFTGQYEGLEALYEKHRAEGLEILAFPSDQFGHQEPGSESEIKTFCTTRYAVKFPLFAKVDVNGPDALPLYRFLRSEAPGALTKDTPGAEKLYAHLETATPEVLGTDAVKWNFTKFLVDRQGHVVRRFEPVDTPEAIEPEIAKQLAAR